MHNIRIIILVFFEIDANPGALKTGLSNSTCKIAKNLKLPMNLILSKVHMASAPIAHFYSAITFFADAGPGPSSSMGISCPSYLTDACRLAPRKELHGFSRSSLEVYQTIRYKNNIFTISKLQKSKRFQAQHTSTATHRRVLPFGEYIGMTPEPLAAYSESFMVVALVVFP